ncbi:TIGR03118 family protein [Piscinibacter sp.]|uniref:TIGR03118 family protein n=1 Tax=Piscinibacter sp. TaxID=1903157 RepID=UPI002C6A256A|nr:TIGR03118 family protein [Albitalea sp.]HUG23686.1 TIGR03118 family protein [Albitalea sp.]
MKTLKTITHGLCMALGLALAGTAASQPGTYHVRNLVSDGSVPAEKLDANLVNVWGIAFNPFGPVWVNDHGTGLSTLYLGDGTPRSLVVRVPAALPDAVGRPTGIVWNGSAATPVPSGFIVSKDGISEPSRFIFSTEDGTISAWSLNVDANNAIVMVNNASAHAVYKGLALSGGGNGALLYAADFRNNRIDVFDTTFTPVTLPTGAFVDPAIPAGYAPFGLQNINGNVYVSYARQDATKTGHVRGKGLGFVNVFDPNGALIRRVASQGKLDAPWGLALAPAGFGKFSNRLLVANAGDGRINAYDLVTGAFVGKLHDAKHQPIEIDGLWGIAFGPGFALQPVNTLYFTAGPRGGQGGLYGRIDASSFGGMVDTKEND